MYPTMPAHPNNVAAITTKLADSAPHAQTGSSASAAFPPSAGQSAEAHARQLLSAELVETWLSWQCQMVSGVIRGAVFVPDSQNALSSLAVWPQDGNGETQLYAAATQALKQSRSVTFAKIAYGTQGQRVADFIACPVDWQGKTVAVIAMALAVRSEPQQHAVLQLMRWGGLWIETLIDKSPGNNQIPESFAQALAAAALAQPSLRAATTETVNFLAQSLDCERVSLGFKEGLLIKLSALSNTTSFDPRTQFVHALESAMDEACDAKQTLVEPPFATRSDHPGYKAHKHLLERHGAGTICTVLLQDSGANQIGAITLECAKDRPLTPGTLRALEAAAALLTPILELKKRNEEALSARLRRSAKNTLQRFLGPTHLRSKLAVLALVVTVALGALIDGDYEAKAPSNIEGAVSQLLVAPHSSYIKQAFARAGDHVLQGQVLATLDDRSLRLTLEKWQSELSQIDKQYQDALARRDRTELGIYQAKREQIQAEIQLSSDALKQTQLRAPFDGIVISGDPGQSLGAPVEIGQTLFEVAPLEDYRVMLEVREEDIGQVTIGSEGRLIVAALPDEPLRFTVERIVPVAETTRLNNVFRIEAALEEPPALLRPGMRGVARIELGQRKLLWLWTHGLIERVRLWAWTSGM